MIRSISFAVAALVAGVVAQSPLETTFANPVPGTVVNNTSGNVVTGLFDVTVTEPQGVVLTQIDLQINTSTGTNGQLGLWITGPGGTHVGNQLNAAAWTQVSSSAVVHNGGRVSFLLQQPVVLAPATYGIALHCVEANPVYHNATTSLTLPQTYSNNEMLIDMSACRTRSSTLLSPFGGTGAGFSPRQLAVGLHYTVGGTSVDFSGTPTAGASPLPVQFTSIATSGAPGGITTYAWDFENDGVYDDFTPNPLHVYTQCGTYTVTLTIFDANGSYTETKTDYVVTDVVTPSFTHSLVAPNTVQFVDTSSPTPGSWSWDFDGDGIVDSTAQNPLFVYPNACEEVSVSLTVQLACQPAATLTKPIAVSSSIETTFQGGLITAAAALSSANYFDVDVVNPRGISVCAMHVNNNLAAGNQITVDIYQRAGTYVGATADASLWRLVGSETVTTVLGRDFVAFSTPIYLPFGQHGICMVHTGTVAGASPTYTNLGGTQVYGNADVTITAGASQDEPVLSTGAVFSPRIANVALHYSTSQVTSVAGYGHLAEGCPGSLGIPTNVAATQPTIGSSASIVVDRLPLGIGVMVLGTTQVTPAFDLGLIGMPGCLLHSSGEVLASFSGVGTQATFNLPIPNNPGLVGMLVYTQCAGLDLGLNPFQFSISDASVMLLGQ